MNTLWRRVLPRRLVHRCKCLSSRDWLLAIGILLCLRVVVPYALHTLFVATAHFETRPVWASRNLEHLHMDVKRAFNKSDAEIDKAASAGVSVVLLNWGRPEIVLHTVLPALVSCSNVAQCYVSELDGSINTAAERNNDIVALYLLQHRMPVVVSHGRRDTAYISELAIHPKLLHRLDYKPGGLNAMLGVASRFEAALLDASQPWVLIMDDDILPSEEQSHNPHVDSPTRWWRHRSRQLFAGPAFLDRTLMGIQQLINAMAQNPNRIVGKWGRTQHIWPFYDTVDVHGDCDVVLTKFMMMQRDAMQVFFDYADILGLARGLPGSRVVWNGEDLFMSLVHSAASGHRNHALPPPALGDVTEMGGVPGMSADLPKDWRALVPSPAHLHALVHWWHRSRFWAVVVDRLARLHATPST